jgi:hypothetical protein
MYQTPHQSRHARSGISGASTRVQQRLRSMRARPGQGRLDEELAAGVRPDSDPLLRERARHLLSRDARLKMAAALGRAIYQAERPGVRDAVPTLASLARRLRGSRPIAPQGAAKTQILLTDANGPLYHPNAEPDLKTAARRALAALDSGSGRRRAMPRRVSNPGW